MLHTWVSRSLLASFSMTGIFAFQSGPGEKSLRNLCRHRVSWFPPPHTHTWMEHLEQVVEKTRYVWRLVSFSPLMCKSQQVSLLIIVAACPWIPTAPSSSSPNKCFNFNFIYFVEHFSYKKQLKVHRNKERKHKQERERKEKKIETNPTPPAPTNTETRTHSHTYTYTGAQTQTYTYTHWLRKHFLIVLSFFFLIAMPLNNHPHFYFHPPLNSLVLHIKNGTKYTTFLFFHQLSWNETYKINLVAVWKKKTCTLQSYISPLKK